MWCSLRKQLECFGNTYNSLSNSMNSDLEVSTNSEYLTLRRFGLDASGNAISINKYGEPLDLNAQNYYERTISGVIMKQDNINDEKSTIGGKSSEEEFLQVKISLDLDIQENDVVEYPVSSNNWYRVNRITYIDAGSRKLFKAKAEVRGEV